MKKLLKRLWRDEQAVTAVEYGIIAAILAVGIILILVRFQGNLRTMFGRAGGAVTRAPN